MCYGKGQNLGWFGGMGEDFGHAMAPGSEAVINQILAPMLIGRDLAAINHRIAELERLAWSWKVRDRLCTLCLQ